MSRALPIQERREAPAVETIVRYHTANVGGIKIFYREASKQEAFFEPLFGHRVGGQQL
jgi:hypothetical protein